MRKNGREAGEERAAGVARATIVDVARRAGVSKSTVSLVLGGSSLVADSTRERVADAMSELGYIYHRGAATLRGAKSGLIGMVINDLSNPFYVELAIGIEQACQGAAYVPFLANTAENPVRQQEVIRSMREHGAAGLVLAPAIGTSASELKPLLAGLPVVLVICRRNIVDAGARRAACGLPDCSGRGWNCARRFAGRGNDDQLLRRRGVGFA